MVNPVEPLRKAIGAVDAWQRRHRWAGVPYAVMKKFGDDNANLVVVALAWYGFTAIFPLLLVVVTIVRAHRPGSRSGPASCTRCTSSRWSAPSFNPASRTALHGSTLGLVIGLIGLLYGAQGVTQTAQQAMATVWNIPQIQRTGFLPRLGRSLAGLITIGVAFLVNAFVTTYATGGTSNYAIRIPVLAGLLVLNCALYFATFTLLTAKAMGPRGLLPGAILGAVGVHRADHRRHRAGDPPAEERHRQTYGAFGAVIGIVAFLLLLAKLSLYAAELNPVLARRLYPRALPMGNEPTDADRRGACLYRPRRTAPQRPGDRRWLRRPGSRRCRNRRQASRSAATRRSAETRRQSPRRTRRPAETRGSPVMEHLLPWAC